MKIQNKTGKATLTLKDPQKEKILMMQVMEGMMLLGKKKQRRLEMM